MSHMQTVHSEGAAELIITPRQTALQQAMIPITWLSIMRRLTEEELLILAEEVSRRGVSRSDLAQVRLIWNELRPQKPGTWRRRIHG